MRTRRVALRMIPTIDQGVTMRTVACALVVCLSVSCALAGDWPRWRGPHLNGISDETGWLDRWPKDEPPVAWRAAVGIGFSTVSVHQGQLYTMGHREGRDVVSCLDAITGKQLWSHAYAAELGDLN